MEKKKSGTLLSRQFFTALFVILVAVSAGFAQSVPPQAETKQPNAAQYIIQGERAKVQKQVNIWGEVQKPGIYKVPQDMGLISLISSAGGPTDVAKLKEVKIVHAFPQEGEDSRVIVTDLKHYIESADASDLPEINPGDTIYVPGNWRRYFSETLGIAGSIAGVASAVALIYERLIRASAY